jgi:DNA-binding MltR family transcriptional regulator
LDSRLLEERTSWISAKLLDYMQRLILDEQLRLLIDSVTNGDHDAIVIVLETLLSRGHTSGIDIAVGIILALSLIRDIVLNKEETKIIARTLGLSKLA